MAVTASYISPAMRRPSSGGLNQRERTNIDSLARTSASRANSRRDAPIAQISGAQEPFAPSARPRLGGKELADVGMVEPQVAQSRRRQIVAQCARQHRAVDAARRRSGDDIDDHPQLDLAAEFAQQIEIDCFAVVFRVVGVDKIGEGGVRPLGPVGDLVQRARGANELEYFLGDAVHVDGERNAAEAHQRKPKLFLLHGRALPFAPKAATMHPKVFKRGC